MTGHDPERPHTPLGPIDKDEWPTGLDEELKRRDEQRINIAEDLEALETQLRTSIPTQAEDPTAQVPDTLEELPKRRRDLIGTLGHMLSQTALGRSLKTALAVFAFSAVMTEPVNETPQKWNVQDARTEGESEKTTRAETEVTIPPIEISSRGALEALKEVIEHEPEVPWVSSWLQSVREHARPDLVETRTGRLYVYAQTLGFLQYDPNLKDAEGKWVPYSPPLPKGAFLQLTSNGLSLHTLDGNVQPLVVAHPNGTFTLTPYE
jgi:hypothetical protein